ncbi:hypothetical protein B5807_05466 [Epicoccum nigrum]|uniref:Superoxide dismutase [Cu-Zn] n=1 Tax=Epicoccum nigrum TaxID=105696 RepID=A0A1Y2M1R0_EPING|nr:hypothetical protein B5807_05466 [Epicoccum nigrum]
MVKAVAVLRGDSNIKGTVTFEQADENSQTTVTWNISGHDANAERGMHVHAFGDNTNGCTSAGPHFNPHNKTHGAPEDEERHVGDLGNFKTDAQGNAQGCVQDKLIKLIGSESVIGVSPLAPITYWYTRTKRSSAPLLSTLAPMISARVDTRSPRRLATLAPAPLAVSLVSPTRYIDTHHHGQEQLVNSSSHDLHDDLAKQITSCTHF